MEHLSVVKKLAELKFKLMFAKSYQTGLVYSEFQQDLQVRQKVLEKMGTQMQDAELDSTHSTKARAFRKVDIALRKGGHSP